MEKSWVKESDKIPPAYQIGVVERLDFSSVTLT